MDWGMQRPFDPERRDYIIGIHDEIIVGIEAEAHTYQGNVRRTSSQGIFKKLFFQIISMEKVRRTFLT